MNPKVLCAFLIPVVAVAGMATLPRGAKISVSLPSPSLQQVAVVALTAAAATNAHPAAVEPTTRINAESIDLQTAVDQGIVAAEFRGNGRERMRAALKNKTNVALSLKIPAGQMLENARNTVLVTRSGEADLRAGGAIEVVLDTAGTRSANRVADADYRLSYGTIPRLDALLTFAQTHPELSPGAVQTAVLALVENLPLSAVSKFSSGPGDLPSRFDTTAFRVETADLLKALTVLREVGVKDAELAMTVDPQLKIETMIEPALRDAAMRYYGMTAETEWAFWKTELLSGDPATRHYALYGIARFYPDIALEMLPKWARETKTSAVFRLSALQALGDTQRPEALPILRQLADELGRETEFGHAATMAAQFLETQLAKLSAAKTSVAFRESKTVSHF